MAEREHEMSVDCWCGPSIETLWDIPSGASGDVTPTPDTRGGAPRHYTNALVEHDRYCLNGWPSPKPCNYTGGCYCFRDAGHRGRCRCTCGSTSKPVHEGDGTM